MALGYGSRFELSPLSSSSIGQETISSGSNLFGIFKVLLNIVEVGLTFATGGVGGVAIGIGSTAINTGVDYAETGKVNPVNLGIQLGTSILPGIGSVFKGIGERTIAREYNPLLKQLTKDVTRDTKYAQESFGTLFQRTNKINDKFATYITNRVKRQGERIAILKQSRQLAPLKRITRKQINSFLNNISKLGYGGSVKRLSRFYNLSSKTILGIGGSVRTGEDINARLLRSIKNETGLLYKEIKALQRITRNGRILNIAQYYKIMRKAYARTGNELLGLAIQGAKQSKFLKVLARKETSAMKMSRISSKSMQWTTKIGSYLVSPSSLAADAISKTVARVTKNLEKIGEELSEKLSKWVKLGSKSIRALESEFIKTGGIVFSSKWLMGYKVLQQDALSATILIQFKNIHPNVIVKLTLSNIKAFAESPSKGRWYINNVARNRGGRKVNELGIDGRLANLLGMLPISKINEIVGFASFSKGTINKIRANTGTFIWQTGKYIKDFKSGIIKGIISESIKGAVSLGTSNKYAKQVLEGGFGSVSSGTSFSSAFSSSFNSGISSYKNNLFDETRQGKIVKNVNVIKGTGSSIKGVL